MKESKMAIILEGSDFSPVMWGKIGNYQIRRTRLGKMSILKHVIPFDPNTLAQQRHRESFREARIRWKAFEKLGNLKYWQSQAKLHRFRMPHNAFTSSFVMAYKEKLIELGNHTSAINFVKNTLNPITYKVSQSRLDKESKNKQKIKNVFAHRQSSDYKTKLYASLRYLKDKGWLTETKHGLVPYIDATLETSLKEMGLIPLVGGFGTGTFGTRTYG